MVTVKKRVSFNIMQQVTVGGRETIWINPGPRLASLELAIVMHSQTYWIFHPKSFFVSSLLCIIIPVK